ncbi:MAG: PAS domain S-box protein [candidate division Zixibacteria bacterium]|nr:PAS domain S-box protein [candidate division Zixibacteria bacterium]
MNDSGKTKAQLIEELETLRTRIAKLESIKHDRHSAPAPAALWQSGNSVDDLSLFGALIEYIPDAIIVTGTDFLITHVNRAAGKLYGYRSDELIGKPPMMFGVHDQPQERDDAITDALKAGKIWTGVNIHRRKDGRTFICEESISPITDDTGSVRAFISVRRDITGRYVNEKQHEDHERQRGITMQNAPVMFSMIDDNRIIRFWNRECEQVTGYPADEVVGNPRFFEMLYPDPAYRKKVFENWQRTGNSFRDQEWELTCKDGSRKTVSWSAVGTGPGGMSEIYLNVGIDVTKRRRAEKELRMLQAVVNRAADGIICHAPDGRIFFANEAATGILGYSHEELMTLTAFDIGGDANREAILDVLEQVRKKESYTLTPIVKGHRNRAIPIELTVNHVDHDGEQLYFLFFRDITRRNRIQQALRESEARFRNTFEQAAVGIAHVSLDGRFIRINSRFGAILGYTRDELLEMTVQAITHPDSHDEDLRNVQRLLKNIIPHYSMEMKYIKRDRTSGWVNLTVSLVRDDEGEPQYFISVIEDVSRRKEAETALREERDFVAQLMQTSPAGITTVDREGVITYVNRRAAEILGFDPEKQKSRSFGDVSWHIVDFDGNPFPAKKLPFNVVRHTGQAVHDVQHAIQMENGRRVLLSISAAPLFDANNDFNGMIAVLEDITLRKQIDLQLQASLKEKEILLQEIHHRVKNNLQLVSSLLSLQTESIADDSVLQVLRDCQTRIRTMALIHEALYKADDLSSIDAHAYFRDLANYVTRTYRDQAQHVKLTADIVNISLTIHTAIPCGLIVNELLSNALKHAFPKGETGEIHVSLHRENDGLIRLTVRDNGVGLPPAVDVEKSASLGLQLIKTLAGQINATVEIDRANGTAFTLSFVPDSVRKE